MVKKSQKESLQRRNRQIKTLKAQKNPKKMFSLRRVNLVEVTVLNLVIQVLARSTKVTEREIIQEKNAKRKIRKQIRQ